MPIWVTLVVLIYVSFPVVTTAAETIVERQACERDAFNVCPDAIPDRHRVFQCLLENRRSLSDACQAVMARYSRPQHGDHRDSVRDLPSR